MELKVLRTQVTAQPYCKVVARLQLAITQPQPSTFCALYIISLQNWVLEDLLVANSSTMTYFEKLLVGV